MERCFLLINCCVVIKLWLAAAASLQVSSLKLYDAGKE